MSQLCSFVKQIAAAAAVVIFASIAISCARKESMAGRSAAAFREAQQHGNVPAATNHGGLGHQHGATTTPAEPDHAAMGHHDMSAMNESMPGMQHGTMAHATRSTGHEQIRPTMEPMDHAAMGHAMPEQPRPQQPSTPMQHPMHGPQHAATPEAALAGFEPPRSAAEIGTLEPASTLRVDPQDAPQPVSTREAARAGASQPSEQPLQKQTPPAQQHQHPPHGARQ